MAWFNGRKKGLIKKNINRVDGSLFYQIDYPAFKLFKWLYFLYSNINRENNNTISLTVGFGSSFNFVFLSQSIGSSCIISSTVN